VSGFLLFSAFVDTVTGWWCSVCASSGCSVVSLVALSGCLIPLVLEGCFRWFS
jgi:hypothetical protein